MDATPAQPILYDSDADREAAEPLETLTDHTEALKEWSRQLLLQVE